jgi:phage shock protein C
MSQQKTLYRDTNNKVFAGVCSGIAKYADLDVTLVRLLLLFTAIVPGLIFYVIAAIIMPVEEENGQEDQ